MCVCVCVCVCLPEPETLGNPDYIFRIIASFKIKFKNSTSGVSLLINSDLLSPAAKRVEFINN